MSVSARAERSREGGLLGSYIGVAGAHWPLCQGLAARTLSDVRVWPAGACTQAAHPMAGCIQLHLNEGCLERRSPKINWWVFLRCGIFEAFFHLSFPLCFSAWCTCLTVSMHHFHKIIKSLFFPK